MYGVCCQEATLDGGFKHLFIFTPQIGEDSHFDSYFLMGWNHQPELEVL